MLAGRGDIDDSRNGTAKIELRMHLDSGLGGTEVGPTKQGQRQIDRGGVQCVDRVLQLEAQVLADIQPPRLGYQPHGKVAPESPVSSFVGLGQRRACDGLGEPQMVERLGLRVEAGLDISKTVPPSQLGKDHADELLSAPEMTDAILAVVAKGQAVERLSMHQIENLGENVAAGIHGREACPTAYPSSNASHALSCPTTCL